jgi:hypothetical protein
VIANLELAGPKSPCLRRAEHITNTQKFDAICDRDREVCDIARAIYEREIRHYIRDQEYQ